MLSNKKRTTVSILGVCSGLGQKRAGVETAPDVLRQNGLLDVLADFSEEIFDFGDLYPQGESIDACWDLIKNIRETIFSSQSKNNFQITIGGDHSIAIGSVQASLLKNPDTRLIWVDAHGDINTPTTSISGNLHGMPLAFLLGLFTNPIGGPCIYPRNLLLIGIRDLDPAEKEIIQNLGIRMITADEINHNLDKSLQQVNHWMSQSPETPIHLSFDVDSLDPEFAPATGIRVPNGISLNFAAELVRFIFKSGSLASLDIVEFNPLNITSVQELYTTMASIKKILLYALGGNNDKVI